MLRNRFGFVVWFVLLVSVVASGCNLSVPDEDADAAREAAADFLIVEEALLEYAAENDEFPKSRSQTFTDVPGVLRLDLEAVTPSNDVYDYHYEGFELNFSPNGTSTEPVCNFRLSLVEERFDANKTILQVERSICDSGTIQQLEDDRRAYAAAAEQHLSEIEVALEEYYEENGVFPVSLDALGAEVDFVGLYFVFRDGSKFDYLGKSVASDFDPSELCRYELFASGLSGGDDYRTVNNCE